MPLICSSKPYRFITTPVALAVFLCFNMRGPGIENFRKHLFHVLKRIKFHERNYLISLKFSLY